MRGAGATVTTIAALEELGMEYILGARERTSRVIRNIVLNDTAPMVPLALDRQKGETQLWFNLGKTTLGE